MAKPPGERVHCPSASTNLLLLLLLLQVAQK
jgi:hypothetical protein